MNKPARIILGTLVIVFVAAAIVSFLVRPKGPSITTSVKLADGRILQVEAVTYGTNHVCGESSFLIDRFGVLLPNALHKRLLPKQPRNTIEVDKPSLCVWVNAINSTNGNFVDCQGIRVEFVAENGDLFGSANPHWFGSSGFWREGYVFDAYPRDATELTLHVTPGRKKQTSTLKFPNPKVISPATWTGKPTPQRQTVGKMELELTRLIERTNGSPKEFWETPTRYWKPEWKLSENGAAATGWDEPDWLAEDRLGNTGQFLGVHQPVLRFSATLFPTATNLQHSIPLATLPSLSLTNITTNWWNITVKAEAADLLVLGVFQPGAYTFLDGEMVTNPATPMTAVKGGTPSGWTGAMERTSPVTVKNWHGHYTDRPVIYLSAPSLAGDLRLGIRLRDKTGNYLIAEPESQGHPDGIYAFMLPVTNTVSVVPELVLLKPIKAEFLVATPPPAK